MVGDMSLSDELAGILILAKARPITIKIIGKKSSMISDLMSLKRRTSFFLNRAPNYMKNTLKSPFSY